MKLTIISDDNNLIEDGIITNFDFSSLIDPIIHVVQWDGVEGTIEYRDNVKSPKKIDNIEQFQAIIDAAVDARTAQAEVVAQEEVDRLASMTYEEKRESEYPKIGDQLDCLWKWSEASGLVADAGADSASASKMLADIKATKTKYPKV